MLVGGLGLEGWVFNFFFVLLIFTPHRSIYTPKWMWKFMNMTYKSAINHKIIIKCLRMRGKWPHFPIIQFSFYPLPVLFLCHQLERTNEHPSETNTRECSPWHSDVSVLWLSTRLPLPFWCVSVSFSLLFSSAAVWRLETQLTIIFIIEFDFTIKWAFNLLLLHNIIAGDMP